MSVYSFGIQLPISFLIFSIFINLQLYGSRLVLLSNFVVFLSEMKTNNFSCLPWENSTFEAFSLPPTFRITQLIWNLILFYLFLFRFADDIEFMTGKRPWSFWLFCWKYLSPFALFVILVWTLIDIVRKKPTYSAYVGCTQVRHLSSSIHSFLIFTNFGR